MLEQNSYNYVNQDKTLKNKFYSKVFLYFGIGILVTAGICVVASLIFNSLWNAGDEEALSKFLMYYMVVLGISLIGMIIVSFVISFSVSRGRTKPLIPYILYTIFMGVFTSSFTIFIQNPYIIGLALAITAVLFLLLGFLGIISSDHMKVWIRVVIGLSIAIGLLMLVNFVLIPFAFFGGYTDAYYAMNKIYLLVEALILIVFLIYTAIDFARMKRIAESYTELNNNEAIYCALMLYSDFVVIFRYVLRFLLLILRNRR